MPYIRERSRLSLPGVAASVAALQVVSSFHALPHVPPAGVCISGRCSTLVPSTSLGNQHSVRALPRCFSSPQDTANQDAPEEEKYDGLYEFLTRRTGEQAGETERRRKRDRIKDWMQSSSKRSDNMVQPINMEDGSIMEDPDGPPRTQARFEKLFAGMPTLDEILSREPSDGDAVSPVEATSQATKPPKPDDNWFAEEKKRIENEYKQILNDMKGQIQEQRREDPEHVPANAEGVVESVVMQELKTMLASVKTTRSKERLQDYQRKQINALNSRDLDGASDEVVEEILKEAAEDWKRQEALRAQADDFFRYEKQAQATRDWSSATIEQPESDMDSWVLGRLEKMLVSAQTRPDDEGAVSDILEDNIEQLKMRIESKIKTGATEPRSMKEWQMYRAIATRLSESQNVVNPTGDPILNQDSINEEHIERQLDSWREYIGKEEEIRKRSGLSVGPRMPFDWQRPEKNPDEDEVPAPKAESPGKSRREVRRDMNIQAIQALEELVEKSDSARAENLKQQLEFLRAELEPLDYNDVEEEQVDDQPIEPVDLSGIFGDRKEDKAERLSSNLYKEEMTGIDQILDNLDVSSRSDASQTGPPVEQSRPNTPFFSDNVEAEPGSPVEQFPTKTPFSPDNFGTEPGSPQPNSPFFSEAYDDDESKVDVENSKLGSVDEQKLRAMYRRAGARTKEEQDAIREEWEAFQSLEQAKRSASGLSGDDDSAMMEEANLKYDLSDVMKEGGDFDASKILETIGPRPTRNRKSSSSSSSTATTAPLTSTSTIPEHKYDSTSEVNANPDEAPKSNLDPTEVVDSLYRSVSAVGGGMTKDNPDKLEEEKSEFEDYLKKEEEYRQRLDGLNSDAELIVSSMEDPVDDEIYARDALASIGKRPVFKPRRKQVVDEKKLSDMGGVVSSDEEILSPEEDTVEEDSSVGLIPDWLKQERALMKKDEDPFKRERGGMSGRNIDEVFDDDDYDHNVRQLHEYEQRRAGRQKQMGIDISDVLGRRGTDDYADYTYDTNYFRGRQGEWGETNFEARKASFLEYIELSTAELNNLMDHRESTYTTGVSQYLPRINKPFREFGAIFRLEGVIFDLTGICHDVWTDVASEFDFKKPVIEDVRRASVVKPDTAVREIFFWTTDLFEVQKVVSSFKVIFRQRIEKWAEEAGMAAKTSTVDDRSMSTGMALGSELFSEESKSIPETVSFRQPEDEQTRLKRLKHAWEQTAKELELTPPTNEQIAQCSFLAPEIVVRDILKWSSNQQDIDWVVKVFKVFFDGEDAVGRAELAIMAGKVQGGEFEADGLGEAGLLELQHLAWTKVAEENTLEAPTPEETLAAAVLNDPTGVVLFGFGWTDDSTVAGDLGQQYNNILSELVNTRVHNRSYQAPVPTAVAKDEEPAKAMAMPSDEEVLQSQVQAWGETAAIHGFQPPQVDQIQLTMNLSASDAVRRLLGWAYDFNNDKVNSVTATYEESLKKAASKYVKQYGMQIETSISETQVAGPSKSGPSDDDVYQAAFDAWTNVAWQSGFSMPDQEQVQFAMAVGPEEAVVTGFQWTESRDEASTISDKYRDQIKLRREEWHKNGIATTESGKNDGESGSIPKVTLRQDVVPWIQSLQDVEMGCGVVSYLEEDHVDLLLRYAGLSEALPKDKRVSANNGYDRASQQMLGAALRIERRPDHCLIFDTSPYANMAGHDVEMRCVSLVGPYPRYELMSADTSAVSLDELTAMNIRRLFGERVYDQPMLDMKQNQPAQTRKTRTAFFEDE